AVRAGEGQDDLLHVGAERRIHSIDLSDGDYELGLAIFETYGDEKEALNFEKYYTKQDPTLTPPCLMLTRWRIYEEQFRDFSEINRDVNSFR
ncbi:hypothetical protein ALC53_04629, partial [Atta colombica]